MSLATEAVTLTRPAHYHHQQQQQLSISSSMHHLRYKSYFLNCCVPLTLASKTIHTWPHCQLYLNSVDLHFLSAMPTAVFSLGKRRFNGQGSYKGCTNFLRFCFPYSFTAATSTTLLGGTFLHQGWFHCCRRLVQGIYHPL